MLTIQKQWSSFYRTLNAVCHFGWGQRLNEQLQIRTVHLEKPLGTCVLFSARRWQIECRKMRLHLVSLLMWHSSDRLGCFPWLYFQDFNDNPQGKHLILAFFSTLTSFRKPSTAASILHFQALERFCTCCYHSASISSWLPWHNSFCVAIWCCTFPQIVLQK